MNYEQIKKNANAILSSRAAGNSYIEYKSPSFHLDSILKTICAYGNNYYDNDFQYIYIGVEEENGEEGKAIPKLPIMGLAEGSLEKAKNRINSLRPCLYPNVSFEVLSNAYGGVHYLLIVVPRQSGGPFMVSERAEKDPKIRLKPGRYVRIESDSRLARVDEEYDLLRKFANFHFSSLTHPYATIDDLSYDAMKEYVYKTSDRSIMQQMDKLSMAISLGLVDINDPEKRRVKNYAVLMFSDAPEKLIPYAYLELIWDYSGSKRRMESKTFKGPIWKIYQEALGFIDNNFLSEITLREEGKSDNRKIENFPYVAVEELLANAIVHNNYENAKAIQVYISNREIDIVNYNKPLPPLRIEDLNRRSYFQERDTENPEIRNMFKALKIIESFGTGIGEAKMALKKNGSPPLYYKEFGEGSNITSVVMLSSEEYMSLKGGSPDEEGKSIEANDLPIKKKISGSSCSSKTKKNMLLLYSKLGGQVFSNKDVASLLSCSDTSATSYLKKLSEDLGVAVPVEGFGKGRYRFLSSIS